MPDVLLGAVVGLLVGALAAALLCARWLASARADAAAQKARAEQVVAQALRQETELAAERTTSSQLTANLASAQADRANLVRRLEEESGRLAQMQEQLKTEFENLASRLLEEKGARLLAQNHESLTGLLGPLRERLGEFRERVETIHTEETRTGAALREQLQQLRELNHQMSDEARALTSALKGEAKTQGSWGELILERILEKSGLEKGREYETQASFQAEDGSRYLPDVVIHLPEGRHLIIDAKVSLTAYERSRAGKEGRAAAVREHAQSVRRHVEELARKDYPGLPQLQSPDFVLMFVPVEPALHLALETDPQLYGDAFARNVVLVSSSTLLITLRAIESVWRRHKQTLNALEIARQAGNLHDQFVLFVESLQEVGQRLDQARGSYDKAIGRLADGKGNLIRRVAELQKLGARTEKQLPADLSRRAEESTDPA